MKQSPQKLKVLLNKVITGYNQDIISMLWLVQNRLLQSYSLDKLFDLILSAKADENVNEVVVRKLFTVKDSSSVVIKDFNINRTLLIDAAGIFWLAILEDYGQEEFTTAIDGLIDVYISGLKSNGILMTKKASDCLSQVKHDKLLSFIVVLCLYSMEFGMILARGESSIPINTQGEINES